MSIEIEECIVKEIINSIKGFDELDIPGFAKRKFYRALLNILEFRNHADFAIICINTFDYFCQFANRFYKDEEERWLSFITNASTLFTDLSEYGCVEVKNHLSCYFDNTNSLEIFLSEKFNLRLRISIKRLESVLTNLLKNPNRLESVSLVGENISEQAVLSAVNGYYKGKGYKKLDGQSCLCFSHKDHKLLVNISFFGDTVIVVSVIKVD